MEFKIKGTILDINSHPLPNLIVEAFDSDIGSDDFLGKTQTDLYGNFELSVPENSFKDLFERNPDIYFLIWEGFRILHKTKIKNETKNGEEFKIIISEDEKYIDPYLNARNQMMQNFASIGDSVDPLKANPDVMPRKVFQLMSSLIYLSPENLAMFGLPGPQVPRYPKKVPNHSHSLPWNKD